MILEPARPDSLELARQIFEIDLCAKAINADYDRQAATGSIAEIVLCRKKKITPSSRMN